MTSEPFVPYKHNGKSAGKLTSDGKTYITVRRRDIHLAHRHNGYGIQSAIVKDLVARGVERIVLLEHSGPTGPPTTYRSRPDWWLRDATVDTLRTIDGTQRFLTLKQLREHTAAIAGGAPLG